MNGVCGCGDTCVPVVSQPAIILSPFGTEKRKRKRKDYHFIVEPMEA